MIDFCQCAAFDHFQNPWISEAVWSLAIAAPIPILILAAQQFGLDSWKYLQKWAFFTEFVATFIALVAVSHFGSIDLLPFDNLKMASTSFCVDPTSNDACG